MKKFKFSPRAKKITAVAGSAVICVGILSLVAFRNNSGAQADTAPVSSASLTAVSPGTVSAGQITGGSISSGAGSAWNPEKQKSASAPLTSIAKPSSTPPKPQVKGDSKNGQQPTNPVLTNRSQKPTYKASPQVPAHHSSYAGSGTTPKRSTTTTHQKSSEGYSKGSSNKGPGLPVIVEKGGNQQTIENGDWGNGSQVGIMD